jgi:hypothetical protein
MMKRVTFRAGWVKSGLIVVLLAGGAGGGFYLSGIHTAGCHNPDPDPPARTPVEKPSDGPPSTFTHRFALTSRDAKDTIEAPELAADSAGRVYLAWGSKTADAERSVYFTRTTDAGRSFDVPKAVSKGGVFKSRTKGAREGHERRATPHVAVKGQELHLTWSEGATDGATMRLLLATSTDAGMTFGPPCAVDQAPEANPTFTALAAGPNAELACAWLGGPAGQQPFAAVRRAGATAFEEERLIHAGQDGKGVCPCCPLAACFAPDGTLYVAFRNIADGYRDIAIGVLKPGKAKFEGPFPVVAPSWKFNGCPHDGPSLAVVGEHLHVVWMDARSGPQRCYHARAKLADMAFSAEELHAIPAGTQGNAKLHADAAGRLHAVWEESATAPPTGDAEKHQHGPPTVTPGAGGRAIWYAVLGSDGRFGSPRTVAPRIGAFQTRPAITVTNAGRALVAWNELDETGKAIVVNAFVPEVRQ